MVRREADGVTLYWIQDGQKMSVTKMEYQYQLVEAVQENQITAARVNNRVRTNYSDYVKQVQVSEDASRPYPPYGGAINDDGTSIPKDADGKPLMWYVPDPVMDEYGNVAFGGDVWVAWSQPLPTVRKKVVNA